MEAIFWKIARYFFYGRKKMFHQRLLVLMGNISADYSVVLRIICIFVRHTKTTKP